MIDISNKSITLRIAIAKAIVEVGSRETINRILDGTIPKGDLFEMSRTAGLLAAKNTPYVLPHCHPLPVEYCGIEFEIDGNSIEITATLKANYKTGVEVEAMYTASVVALNMYDMLKPIDKEITIGSIHLVSKSGGKSDYTRTI